MYNCIYYIIFQNGFFFLKMYNILTTSICIKKIFINTKLDQQNEHFILPPSISTKKN